MAQVLGIHHVTSIAGDAQRNVDFFSGVLGLRLVKRTVNFDDPFTYHFYYGDESGSPGTVLTFFPWGTAARRGRAGNGQLTVTAFSVPVGSVGFWKDRLESRDVEVRGPFSRLEEEVIAFRDPDGLEYEIVGSERDRRAAWLHSDVPAQHSIRGFYTVTLSVEGYERTGGLLTATLGFRVVAESGNRFRFEVGEGGPGAMVDVLCRPDAVRGTTGVGTTHHVAWRLADDDGQLQMRNELAELNYNVTPVMDRSYFHSIYFREPGGVLFEGATDRPGFTVDEPVETLGTGLMLPSWLEPDRELIAERLPAIHLPGSGRAGP